MMDESAECGEASSEMMDYGRKNAGHGRITLAV